jgi:hypothetical protein
MRIRNIGALAVLSVLTVAAAARAQAETILSPIHAGYIADQSPFDGLGDGIDETGLTVAGLTSGLGDFRAVVEYDLTGVRHHRRISGATLEVIARTSAYLDPTTTIPIQLFSFTGEGALNLADFNQGCFVGVFEGFALGGTIVRIDVSDSVRKALRRNDAYLGFTMRTNVHGAQVVFGGPTLGYQPALIVTFED